MARPREPVTISQLAEQVGAFKATETGERVLTRKGMQRLARAAWRARRKGLLIHEDPSKAHGPAVRFGRRRARAEAAAPVANADEAAVLRLSEAVQARLRESDAAFAADLERLRQP